MYHLVSLSLTDSKPLPFFFFMPMESLIKNLTGQQIWEEFLAYRLKREYFNWADFVSVDNIIEKELYLPFVQKIIDGAHLSIPKKRIINKIGSDKKRTVYSFTPEEMTILKVLSFLLYRYDAIFSPNCYAFRRNIKASDAVKNIYNAVKGKHLWAYKVDIHNYFNSISIPLLLPKLKTIFTNDAKLYSFFERMLCNNRVRYKNTVISEPHGIMAGVPTSSFLANVFLRDMDAYFYEENVIYARYSDDIILFAEDYSTLLKHKDTINNILKESLLEINPLKENIYTPDEPFEFLGFKCGDGKIDISSTGIRKMKDKIRRKTKAILRWKQQKEKSSDEAMKRLINYANRKFFGSDDNQTFTWSRWYFPIINRVEGLQVIDHYLQQNIRVLATGKYKKSNYKTSYKKMKEMGYKSLVSEYWLSRKNRR